MTYDIKLTDGRYTTYIQRPLVSNDVNAYRVVFDCKNDLTGSLFTVEAMRADGEIIFDSGSCAGNTATYIMKNSMYSVAGELVLRMRIAKDAAIITEAEAICEVLKAFDGGEAADNNNVPILDKLIIRAQTAAAEAQSASQIANEALTKAQPINEKLDGKVDKETGKGLSANDYTDEEKEKLSGIGAIQAVGDIGLVKLGDLSKGLQIYQDGSLCIFPATENQVKTSKGKYVPLTADNVHFAAANSTHQTMSDTYDVTSMSVATNMTGKQGTLPASYDAVKSYIDSKNGLPTITYEELNSITNPFLGIAKYHIESPEDPMCYLLGDTLGDVLIMSTDSNEGYRDQKVYSANGYVIYRYFCTFDDSTEWSEWKREEKVNEVAGKGLSTNDYTDEEKEKLARVSENGKLLCSTTLTEAVRNITIEQDDDGALLELSNITITLKIPASPSLNAFSYASTCLYLNDTTSCVINDGTVISAGTEGNYHYVVVNCEISKSTGMWMARTSAKKNSGNLGSTTAGTPDQTYIFKNTKNSSYEQLLCKKLTVGTSSSTATMPVGTVVEVYGK